MDEGRHKIPCNFGSITFPKAMDNHFQNTFHAQGALYINFIMTSTHQRFTTMVLCKIVHIKHVSFVL
jgi:hypothetical protein